MPERSVGKQATTRNAGVDQSRPDALMSPEAIIGAALAVVGIAVSVVLYRLQRRRKSLEYSVVAQTPLVSAQTSVPDALELRFKGEPVEDVRLLTLAILNAGTEPISIDDFPVGPLKVRLACKEGSVRILSAEVRNPQPPNLGPAFTFANSELQIHPLLLNPGDSFGIQMLTDGGEAGVDLDGRIKGVSRIKRFDPEGQRWSWLAILAYVTMGAAVGIIVVVPFSTGLSYVLASVIYLAAVGMLLIAAWLRKRRRAYTRVLLERQSGSEQPA